MSVFLSFFSIPGLKLSTVLLTVLLTMLLTVHSTHQTFTVYQDIAILPTKTLDSTLDSTLDRTFDSTLDSTLDCIVTGMILECSPHLRHTHLMHTHLIYVQAYIVHKCTHITFIHNVSHKLVSVIILMCTNVTCHMYIYLYYIHIVYKIVYIVHLCVEEEEER